MAKVSIYNRSYMRADYPGASRPWSAVKWVGFTLLGAFILQMMFQEWFQNYSLMHFLELSWANLRQFKLHGLLTYSLLHADLWHFLGNVIGIILLGRVLQERHGSQRFLEVFLGGVLAGAVLFLISHALFSGFRGSVIGASAGVFAVIVMSLRLLWGENITMLLFFIPVSIPAKWVFYFLVFINAFLFLFSEIPAGLQQVAGGGISYSAHVGGIAFALAYERWLVYRPTLLSMVQGWRKSTQPDPLTRRKAVLKAKGAGKYAVNLGPAQPNLRKEIDRILDKINEQGFGSLTEEEKRVLDRAKDKMQ